MSDELAELRMQLHDAEVDAAVWKKRALEMEERLVAISQHVLLADDLLEKLAVEGTRWFGDLNPIQRALNSGANEACGVATLKGKS